MIYDGGPIFEDNTDYTALHTLDVMTDKSRQLRRQNLAVTEGFEIFKQNRKPRHMLFARGYAGWGPKQLDHEIKQGLWHVISYQPELVFGNDDEKDTLWERAMKIVNGQANSVTE